MASIHFTFVFKCMVPKVMGMLVCLILNWAGNDHSAKSLEENIGQANQDVINSV